MILSERFQLRSMRAEESLVGCGMVSLEFRYHFTVVRRKARHRGCILLLECTDHGLMLADMGIEGGLMLALGSAEFE